MLCSNNRGTCTRAIRSSEEIDDEGSGTKSEELPRENISPFPPALVFRSTRAVARERSRKLKPSFGSANQKLRVLRGEAQERASSFKERSM